MLSGLEDDLLHLLNMSGLLAFGWFSPCRVPPFPSVSRVVSTSGFAFAVYFLIVACCFFMPKVVTVVALLLEVCTFICGVFWSVAKFADGGGRLCEGSPACWL